LTIAKRPARLRDRRNLKLATRHYERALGQESAGDLDAAVVALRSALDHAPDRVRWHLKLGRLLERTGDQEAARAAYAAGLRVDPTAHAQHAELLARDAWRFPVRRRVLDFVADHLTAIRNRAEPNEAPLTDPKIFVYWAQGIDTAPAVVQRNLAELRRLHSATEIVVLDQSAWADLQVAPITLDKIKGRPTHGSDVLRLELLYRHGGIWLDSTCLVRRPLRPLVPELAPTGFFAFERAPYRLSNWMMVSAPGHYLVAMMRAALHTYWANFDRVIDYFVFHHLFEALCALDPAFRQAWEATPRLSANPPHGFLRVRFQPYDPARYQELMDRCFVLKLSYKGLADLPPDSLMAWFLEHGAPPD